MNIDKSIKEFMGSISDGYHTFDELYMHRHMLFLLLCEATTSKVDILKNHYEGWDCIFLALPTGQISYHIPSYLIKELKCDFNEIDKTIWDGHTSDDVLNRLKTSIKYEQLSVIIKD